VLTLKVHRLLLLLLPNQVLCDRAQLGRAPQRHGFCLLRLGHQHCVAAQHHRLVLHLSRVRDAVGYPVQQVQVSRPPGLVVHMHHPDALRWEKPSECDCRGEGGLNQVILDLLVRVDCFH
uniref:Secreted protein n=1 Tax=Dicentrarchus labrax TaxID=13489 RepID=A0A8C4FBM1_DICLA